MTRMPSISSLCQRLRKPSYTRPCGKLGVPVITVTLWPARTHSRQCSKVREAGAFTSGGKLSVRKSICISLPAHFHCAFRAGQRHLDAEIGYRESEFGMPGARHYFSRAAAYQPAYRPVAADHLATAPLPVDHINIRMQIISCYCFFLASLHEVSDLKRMKAKPPFTTMYHPAGQAPIAIVGALHKHFLSSPAHMQIERTRAHRHPEPTPHFTRAYIVDFHGIMSSRRTLTQAFIADSVLRGPFIYYQAPAGQGQFKRQSIGMRMTGKVVRPYFSYVQQSYRLAPRHPDIPAFSELRYIPNGCSQPLLPHRLRIALDLGGWRRDALGRIVE